jgi:hypothetical protein
VHATPPSTLSFALRWFDAELVIEDHDLHHRKGCAKDPIPKPRLLPIVITLSPTLTMMQIMILNNKPPMPLY